MTPDPERIAAVALAEDGDTDITTALTVPLGTEGEGRLEYRTGGVVASDMLPDDYPVVEFTPPANGQYVIRMLMQTCTIAPCYAGARILSQGGGGTPGK